MHRLLVAIDRFSFDHDRAQQHREGSPVRHGAASIVGGHVLIEQFCKTDALDEVIDEGKRSQPLGDQSEVRGEWLARLRWRHSGDNNIASSGSSQ